MINKEPEKRRDVVEAVIVNEKNEVLLQKKTLDYPICPGGYWCFFGGIIEPGENPKNSLIRELKEELGLDFNENIIEFMKSREYEIAGYKVKAYNFIVKFEGKLSDIKATEGGGFAFFDKSELKDLKLIPNNIEILEEYFNN